MRARRTEIALHEDGLARAIEAPLREDVAHGNGELLVERGETDVRAVVAVPHRQDGRAAVCQERRHGRLRDRREALAVRRAHERLLRDDGRAFAFASRAAERHARAGDGRSAPESSDPDERPVGAPLGGDAEVGEREEPHVVGEPRRRRGHGEVLVAGRHVDMSARDDVAAVLAPHVHGHAAGKRRYARRRAHASEQEVRDGRLVDGRMEQVERGDVGRLQMEVEPAP